MTVGVVDPTYTEGLDARGRRDVYGKVIHAFQNPYFVVIYLAAQAVLGLHLGHALSSSLQTLGLEHPFLDRLFRGTGPAVALLVVSGNVAIVLAVALGIVRV
jgi:succinate dehydrogenase / fumarate reductase cytochrome b subunit